MSLTELSRLPFSAVISKRYLADRFRKISSKKVIEKTSARRFFLLTHFSSGKTFEQPLILDLFLVPGTWLIDFY
jgi:hypothetical protein